MTIGLPRMWLSVVAALAPVLLGGCGGALSHIEVQRRLDATYAGFPPDFAEASLNGYRATYLAEKAAYDDDPDGFLGVDRPGQDCAIAGEVALALADSSFRLPIQERSPSWRDYMEKHRMAHGDPVYDAVAVKVLEGNCAGGTVNGPSSIVLTYLRVVEDEAFRTAGRQYTVYETTVREACSYRAGRRDGPCTRYTRMRIWDGRFTGDGRLIPAAWAAHEAHPDVIGKPDESDYLSVTTVFDYGRYDDGIETGPGVAFETTPIVGNGINAVENHTLSRMTTEDGRVRYVEYYGGTRKLTYLLRRGVAHGELVWFEENMGGDQRECFIAGELVLTRDCGA